jgi:tight adherence protein C
MLYLISALFACSIGLATVMLVQLMPSRPAAVSRRLEELAQISTSPFEKSRRRERQTQRARLEGILQQLGERVQKGRDYAGLRDLMVQAGYRKPNAPMIYRGVRLAAPLALGAFGVMMSPVAGKAGLMVGMGLAVVGWIVPSFYIGGKVRKRQKDLRKALPDALDALVVCVEAGLGLNQAMVRVAEEIRHISVLMSEELALTNLEMRAGVPREEALRNLASRTGLPDLRSLVTMLIQTDRFGTSIAQALRVQSDTLREKRKQRAEEAAAKTSIKMLFPLIFFIFPAMFVITLGPAVIQLIQGFANRPIP